jgi:hypothetical protein
MRLLCHGAGGVPSRSSAQARLQSDSEERLRKANKRDWISATSFVLALPSVYIHPALSFFLTRAVSEAPDYTFLIRWISSFESPLNFSLEQGNIASCGRLDLG